MFPLNKKFALAMLLSIATLNACCPPMGRVMGDPRNPYPAGSQPKFGEIVHLPTGREVTPQEMLSVAKDARIVYVGETHDNPASHRLELELLKGLEEMHPGHQSLGMEMFSRSQQPALDKWVAGKMGEKEFLRESNWYKNWNIDFEYYRDILIFARDHRVPVIALNAEKGVVDAVRMRPIEQLTPSEKAQLPEMDMGDPYQRAMAAAYFSDRNHGGMEVDGFIRAQTLWDETMAESIARYLTTPAGKGHHLLVVAGGNHVNYGFGIPRRVFRRLPVSYLTVGGREIRMPKEKEGKTMNVTLPSLPMPPYNFLAYLDYEELPRAGVRLGVQIEPRMKGEGLVILGIVPGSNAELAGLKEGDILREIDGVILKDNLDLVYFLKEKRPGDRLHLNVMRGGEEMKVDFLIPLPKEIP
jgi:uncharacterized iron-regulated protein